MIRSIKELIGFKMQATDGEFGNVHDFYFDERIWLLRYLIADTSPWLPDRLVLISPVAIETINWDDRSLSVNLNQEQVINSPSIGEEMPVSVHKEIELLKYYGWPNYWQPLEVNLPESAILFSKNIAEQASKSEDQNPNLDNPFLRSTNEIIGYKIRAKGGKVGHIYDYLIEDDNWIIRYFVVKINIWGKKVLLAPNWIDKIDWAHHVFKTELARKLVKEAQKFDYSIPIDREFASKLQDYTSESTS